MSPTLVWAVWATTALGSFLALELPAVRNARKGDTLSEQLRVWFHTGHTAGRITWLLLFALFAAWFGPHIALPAGHWFP